MKPKFYQKENRNQRFFIPKALLVIISILFITAANAQNTTISNQDGEGNFNQDILVINNNVNATSSISQLNFRGIDQAYDKVTTGILRYNGTSLIYARTASTIDDNGGDYNMTINQNGDMGIRGSFSSSGSLDIGAGMSVVGNVGIGTTNPTSRFQIHGSSSITSAFDESGAFLNLKSDVDQLLLDPNEIYAKRSLYIGTHSDSKIIFRSLDNGSSDYDNTMVIKGDGNVGINEDEPEALLHIGSSASDPRQDGSIILGKTTNGNANLRLGYHTDYAWIQSHGSKPLYINSISDNNTILNVEGGNVGIGTTNPSKKLEVDGTVKADAVELNIGSFPDYVFKADYHLLPLAQVEAFIHENGRLPNMPSEKEVVENGMDVGQINVLLVEKVEELTLHSIAQQKEMDQLKIDLAEMKATMNQLSEK